MPKPISAVTRVNVLLKQLSREERLVRGRGYYYLHLGDACYLPAQSIYVYRLEATEEDFRFALSEVCDLFAASDKFKQLAADLRKLGGSK